MAITNGFVKLYRKFIEWEWYKDQNTKAVFIHLLLHANISPSRYKGYQLQAGELVVGRKKLAEDLGMSEQEVRTALRHLESTGEIAKKSTNKFSIIAVEKWRIYAETGKDNQPATNQQSTSNQPATNQQSTTEREEEEEYKNIYVSKDTYVQTSEKYKSVIEHWNALGLNKLRAIKSGSTRAKMLDARLREYSKEEVISAIDSIHNSDFLCGRNNTGWCATFDWLIKPNNFQKVLEGNYENREKSNKTAEMLEEHYRMAEEWANEQD